jgi:hypothetical protein
VAPDWKKEVDARLERERVERAEVEKKREAEKAYQDRVRDLGNRFQCCVCGKRATRPLHRSMAWDSWVDDWSQPGDLYKCKADGPPHWACDEHYYRGYCYNHHDQIHLE